jgi:neutral ceramidase
MCYLLRSIPGFLGLHTEMVMGAKWYISGFLIGLLFALPAQAEQERGWKAGVAARVITPSQPLWMAGYAGRTRPAEGKLHDLHVKALALEDPEGKRLVLLTADLIAMPRGLAQAVSTEVQRRAGLPRERLLLTVSHTHCGPVLEDDLRGMYDMPAAEAAKIGPYTEKVRDRMIAVIITALGDLKPARLAVGQGIARFAVNRRKPTAGGFINSANPAGPVDHAVPVLRVLSPEGKVRALAFGYACHNTTLSFYQWCGDYAGFAQIELEKKYPGAVALFWAGCGADANPLPRRTVELCMKYGKELAQAVLDVASGKMTEVTGISQAAYAEVALPYAKIPDKTQLASDLLSKRYAVKTRARRLLSVLEKKGKIDDHYRHYPVQVWRLGRQVTWIALGGEVVVDYALRMKKELRGERSVWVTGYANDVMAYIGSARVIEEGGYEGDTSMVYYGKPSKWSTAVEEIIVKKIHELVKAVRHP